MFAHKLPWRQAETTRPTKSTAAESCYCCRLNCWFIGDLTPTKVSETSTFVGRQRQQGLLSHNSKRSQLHSLVPKCMAGAIDSRRSQPATLTYPKVFGRSRCSWPSHAHCRANPENDGRVSRYLGCLGTHMNWRVSVGSLGERVQGDPRWVVL